MTISRFENINSNLYFLFSEGAFDPRQLRIHGVFWTTIWLGTDAKMVGVQSLHSFRKFGESIFHAQKILFKLLPLPSYAFFPVGMIHSEGASFAW